MAELILTEQEKKDSSFLDWSDESLGKAVKKLALLIKDEKGKDASYGVACATFLACQASDMNADTAEFSLEGVTDSGEERGDWIITVQKK